MHEMHYRQAGCIMYPLTVPRWSQQYALNRFMQSICKPTISLCKTSITESLSLPAVFKCRCKHYLINNVWNNILFNLTFILCPHNFFIYLCICLRFTVEYCHYAVTVYLIKSSGLKCGSPVISVQVVEAFTLQSSQMFTKMCMFSICNFIYLYLMFT